MARPRIHSDEFKRLVVKTAAELGPKKAKIQHSVNLTMIYRWATELQIRVTFRQSKFISHRRA